MVDGSSELHCMICHDARVAHASLLTVCCLPQSLAVAPLLHVLASGLLPQDVMKTLVEYKKTPSTIPLMGSTAALWAHLGFNVPPAHCVKVALAYAQQAEGSEQGVITLHDGTALTEDWVKKVHAHVVGMQWGLTIGWMGQMYVLFPACQVRLFGTYKSLWDLCGLKQYPKAWTRLTTSYLAKSARGFSHNFEMVKEYILTKLMLPDDKLAEYGFSPPDNMFFEQWCSNLAMVEAVKQEFLLVMRV